MSQAQTREDALERKVNHLRKLRTNDRERLDTLLTSWRSLSDGALTDAKTEAFEQCIADLAQVREAMEGYE